MASVAYTVIIYSTYGKGMVLWILFFQVVIVMVKDKKRCTIKDAMSIKVSFIHYRNCITWTRIKLLVVFEEFDMVYDFWFLFSFHCHRQLVKVHPPPAPPAPRFLRACKIYIMSHIKKHRFIHFCCVLLRSLKASGLSLIQLLWELLLNVISQGLNQSMGILNVNLTSTEHCVLTRKRNQSMFLNLTVKNYYNFQLK